MSIGFYTDAFEGMVSFNTLVVTVHLIRFYMKNTAFACSLLVGLLLPISFYGQSIYKSYSSKEFKALAIKGITYLRGTDEVRNKTIEEAMAKHWTISEFKAVEANDNSVSSNTIVLIELTLTRTVEEGMLTTTSTEMILAMIKMGDLLKKEVGKYDAIGFICINGFNQKEKFSENNRYMGLAIGALTQCVEQIKRKKIMGKGLAFYKKLGEAINPSVAVLEGKTLLVVGDTYNYVQTKPLDKAGIKYRQITEKQFENLSQEQKEKSCLLYFGYNSYTDICIFDLKDNSLIYTYHYVNAHDSFDKKDVKKIVNYFQR